MNADRAAALAEYERVRRLSLALAAPLQAEDWRVQSMPDVSPPYWNLGHTSWFFARNLLAPNGRAIDGFEGFDYAFNSYYEGLGPRLPRDQRGRVAQPDNAATMAYRRAVDAAMRDAITGCPAAAWSQFRNDLGIGLQHEQQHQELMLTEILHIRWSTPVALRRAYLPMLPRHQARDDGAAGPLRAIEIAGNVVAIGHQDGGFSWDNELPVHRAAIGDLAIGDRLITNAEWLAFLADGGYRQPLLWLSNGWQQVQQHGWQAPLYWEAHAGGWARFALRGLQPLVLDAPVCHISFYEADAFARWYGEQFLDWRGARLPREHEWEHAARTLGFWTERGNLLDDDVAHCVLDTVPNTQASTGARQFAGDVWEWTLSHYEPYPGYRPFAGALMEYNGKFMDNQRVLRGGSFATPRTQARVAYRNFWPASTRFQATGVRLLVDR